MVAGRAEPLPLSNRCSLRSADAFQRNPLREGVGTGYVRFFHA